MRRARLAAVAGALVAGVLVVAAPAPARAQHCHVGMPDAPAGEGDDAHAHQDHHAHHDHAHHGHPGPPRPAPRRWWVAGATTMVAGSGSVGGVGRDYQGVALGVRGGWRRVSGRVSVPAFRVADEGLGLGDVLTAVAADVVPGRGPWRAGVMGSASLPTGSSDAGRGMGHVMVAAGAWTRVRAGAARLDGAVVWARALGDGAEHAAHQHLAAMWPLVDPMNPEELAVDASASAEVAPGLRAGAGATYAAPLSDGGAARVLAYALAELGRGRQAYSVQLAVPAYGDPFVARATLEVAHRF